MKNIIILVLMMATVAWGGATTSPPVATEFKRAWTLDLSTLILDPNGWNDAMKAKIGMVGAGAAYATTLSLPVVQILLFAVFLFGLVKLNWVLVASSCAALYGWKRNRIFLGAGLLVSYCLAFGYSLLGA